MSQKFYCKYYGTKNLSEVSLTENFCHRHPNGEGKDRHELYQGSEKPQYTCMHCGTKALSIASLTSSWCFRHPKGAVKGHHLPTL